MKTSRDVRLWYTKGEDRVFLVRSEVSYNMASGHTSMCELHIECTDEKEAMFLQGLESPFEIRIVAGIGRPDCYEDNAVITTFRHCRIERVWIDNVKFDWPNEVQIPIAYNFEIECFLDINPRGT